MFMSTQIKWPLNHISVIVHTSKLEGKEIAAACLYFQSMHIHITITGFLLTCIYLYFSLYLNGMDVVKIDFEVMSFMFKCFNYKI